MSGSSTTLSGEPSSATSKAASPLRPGRATKPERLERRRRLPWWVSIGIAVGVVAGGGAGVAASPLFHARSIEVTGAAHLDRSQVLRLAGLSPGMNVLWFDAGAAARRLEGDRWIASATVTRSLPSTVRVSVTERSPAAEVKVGSRWALVAADGTILGRVSSDPGLPVLEGSIGNARSLRPPASVVGGMAPWLRSRVRSVSADSKGSMVIELASGVQVLFGAPSDIAVKDQALAGILRWQAGSNAPIGYIDLRAPLAPSAGPGSGPPDLTAADGKAAPAPATGTGA